MVVQSIVSLMSLLRGQLIKYFMTLLLNTLIFFVEKIRAAFALQKLFTFFSTKNISIFEILTFEILMSPQLTTSLFLNNRILVFTLDDTVLIMQYWCFHLIMQC